MLSGIFAIILTLILVVGIHEAGHALAARFFGVRIKKISIGFGKPLLSWHSKSGCEWVWAFFPLGGYVQLDNTRISPVKPEDEAKCFDKKPIWQRIVILLAGAVANVISAWLALVLVYSIGLNHAVPQIKSVQEQSIAAQAGMMPGDKVIAVAGRETPSWNDVGTELIIAWGKKDVPLTLSRNNGSELKQITLNLSQVTFHGMKTTLLQLIGIEPELSAERATLRYPTLGGAIGHANQVIIHTLFFFLVIFKQLFTGVIPFSMLLGPLSIFAVSIVSLTQGFVVFLFFIASLSLAVALVNLFPVPGLDGGSIMYAIIEKIRGKPISVAWEILLHRLALIIFCMVLVHLLMNDLQRF